MSATVLRAGLAMLAAMILAAAASAAEETVFRDVAVIDVLSGEVRPGHDVRVRADKIVAVTPSSAQPPTQVRIVAGAGRFLIPGLAEMHAHVPPPAEQRARGEQLLRLYVANGVTTIRGMLGAPWHLDLRKDIEAGRVLGPRFFAGAPSLNGNSAPDPQTAERLVREYASAGFDFLKLHPGLKREVFDAIVRTAREVRIPFGGHVSENVGIEHALAARQQAVDHLDGYLNALADPQCRMRRAAGFFGIGLTDCMDESRIPALVKLTLEAGTWNVPTQSLLDKFAAPPASVEALRAWPEMRYMPAQTADNWMNARGNFLGSQSLSPQLMARFIGMRRALLRALDAAGAPLLVGADSPQIFNVPGFATHDELASLVRAGISPRAALQAATVNPARLFGREARFGTIAPGKDADLVLLEANPLADIAATRRIAGVMLRGKWLDRAELDRQLKEVCVGPGC
ncbi:MAG TPA: amidohydrolase family protein [Steroidobacteraceae bacterium]|nr:amidohydrolase family protein [Steroidobacteraceae bacterium]